MQEGRAEINRHNIDSAREYLESVAVRFKRKDKPPHIVVLEGRAADRLTDYAKKIGADLIAIATHGRSGVSRWVMGSTSDRLLHYSNTPVLVVRPPGCPAPK